MKKVFIIATVILFFLFIVIFIVTRTKKSAISNQQLTITSTTVPLEQKPINNLKSSSPIETDDFKLEYLPETDKFQVELKTDQGYDQFISWAYENQTPELIENSDLVEFSEPGQGLSITPTPSFNPLIEFLNIFLNFGQGVVLENPSSTNELPNQLPNPSFSLNPPSSSLAYYAQCNGYSNISLPSGCNFCQAGCGPATVAMIASLYLGTAYDPQTIVNLYQSKGYLLGCGGSRYQDAKALLEFLGLKTTDYLIYSYGKADEVAPDFKKYTDSGWTLFVLASFKQSGGGHYFWVTEVDEEGNIWAYDPYYGRYSDPPLNENMRYPFPLYRVAIGVKK